VREGLEKANAAERVEAGAPLACTLDLDVRSQLPGCGSGCVPVKGALGALLVLSEPTRSQGKRRSMYSRNQSRMVSVAGVESAWQFSWPRCKQQHTPARTASVTC
jgi:hypothetical protein